MTNRHQPFNNDEYHRQQLQWSKEVNEQSQAWIQYILQTRSEVDDQDTILQRIANVSYLLGTGMNGEQAWDTALRWENMLHEDDRSFKIVGYYPDYASESIEESIQFDKLTHIMWAFLLPNRDGSVQKMNNLKKMEEIIRIAHSKGKKVYLSVGGWGDADGRLNVVFEEAMSNPTSRERLISNIIATMDQYGFDGVDIDWEFPEPNDKSKDLYTDLMVTLKQRLRRKRKGLSTAVIGGVHPITGAPMIEAQGFSDEALEAADFINLMVYDGGDGPDASPYSFAKGSLDYWRTRVPYYKLVLGVPAYARPSMSSYQYLVKLNPDNAWRDDCIIDGVPNYYNGVPTIQQKAALALREAGGIMIWELPSDTTNNNTSLLSAIYRTVYP